MRDYAPTPEFLAQLQRHEGFFDHPYICTAGAVTIGYGCNLDAHPGFVPPALRDSFLSGRGARERLRVVRGMRWDKARATSALLEELAACHVELLRRCPAYGELLLHGEQARADVLLSMAFNMGVGGLLKFRNTLAALLDAVRNTGNYARVGEGLKQSLWYRQVGRRSRELVRQMVSGQYVGVTDD